jgi:glycosyltransferase involved in cell wall biosynthesis
MKIIIVSDETFSNSTGQEIRQLTYAKGFKELSHRVKIFTLALGKSLPQKLVLNDIEMNFLNSGYKGNFLFDRAKSLLSSLRLCRAIIRENKNGKIDCIMMQSFSSLAAVFLYFVTRRLHIKYIRDQVEYPFIHKPHFGPIRLSLYENYFFKLFDGLAVINEALINYFQINGKSKQRLHKFPIIVDPGRFDKASKTQPESKYIAYCGDMRNNKDGVPILIESFNIISNKHPDIKLYLIGEDKGFKEVDQFKQRVNDLNLSNRIIFTGRIDRDEMPGYLANATLLALARPNNKQAEGGFPSKLGEYLATGKTVVVTKVGEISDYLTDGVNAFLSEPDYPEYFAEKLNFALSNPDLAVAVGTNGKNLASTTFNYKVQAENLAHFIDNLN